MAVTLTGTLTAFTAQVQGIEFRIAGDQNRQTIAVNAPLRQTLTLGGSITAAVDANSDGIPELFETIPWSAFLD